MIKTLNLLEEIHNKAADSNFVWFPFLFLKPKTDEIIDLKRKVKMAICFGCYYSIYKFMISLFWRPVLSAPEVLIASGKFSLLFFLWFTFVTAFFWNRRAKLRQKAD
jgi:hypothetical protein